MPRKRRLGSSKKRYLVLLKDGMQEVGATEDEMFARSGWGNPLWRPLMGKPKKGQNGAL